MTEEDRNMKKYAWLAALTAMLLLIGSAQAEIIPPYGFGQIGLPAVVLCEELTLREEPGATSKALEKLEYGDLPIVMEQSDGWAYVTLGDSEESPKGWLNADYLAIDPAWYLTEAKTPVYAWDDELAPKVALLDEGVRLPILADKGDWLIVSLRGAVGWVQK